MSNKAILLIDMNNDFLHISQEKLSLLIKNQIKLIKNYFYIRKPKTDAFEKSLLLEKLKENFITDLIIMGVFASECIKKTTIFALKNKFRVFIDMNTIEDPEDWEENKSFEFFSKNCHII